MVFRMFDNLYVLNIPNTYRTHVEESLWCCLEQCRRHTCILAWVEVWYQDGQTYGIDITCSIHNVWKSCFIHNRAVCKELCIRQSSHETLWKTTRIMFVSSNCVFQRHRGWTFLSEGAFFSRNYLESGSTLSKNTY